MKPKILLKDSNGYPFFVAGRFKRELTYLPGLCLAEHQLLPSTRLGVSSSCLLTSVTAVQCSKRRVYLKGCSALKILEAVGWEKGTLERSIGEEPVDDLESGRSVGLVVPFCVYLSQYLCRFGENMRNWG